MGAAPDPRLCVDTAAPTNIVIFGATGDLTKRKLMPALVRMLDCGLLHPDSRIIGVVRDMEQDAWLKLVRHHQPDHTRLAQAGDDLGRIMHTRDAIMLSGQGTDSVRRDVVSDHLVSVPGQAPGHVGAHLAQTDHSELHASVLSS